MSKRIREFDLSYDGEPPKKIIFGSGCRQVCEDESEENSEESEVMFITAHLKPDAVIWSDDTDTVPLDQGLFMVGWDLDKEEDEKLEEPSETMFVVANVGKPLPARKDWKNEIQRACHLLKESSKIIIIAGAGLGCDSNLPDYRSSTGFWKDYPPLLEAGISLKDMSKSDWFENDPTLAWGFYSHRQHLYKNAEPHEGYQCLLQWCKKLGEDNYFVVTSNVDSQFQKSGFPEDKIFETHGSLAFQQCLSRCEKSNVWQDPSLLSGNPLSVDLQTFRIENEDQIPKCSSCGGTARPNVSFFSDTDKSFNNERQLQQKEKIFAWLDKVKIEQNENVLLFEIGCGTSIHSLRFETEILLYHIPELLGRSSLIRINPVDYGVHEKSPIQVGIGLGAKVALCSIRSILNNK